MISFSFPSADGKSTLACYQNGCAQPRAMLQISHGMCEYIERYREFAEYLGERGYLVFGHDALGHGSTAKSNDGLGFTAEGGGADYLVEDVHSLSLYMKKQYPSLPLILFGHSMGSFIAREVTAQYGTDYNGAIYCGTGGPQMPAGLGKLVASLLIACKGERHRSTFLAKVAFMGYNKKYKSVRTPCDWLTRDEAVVDRYLADSRCRYIFTLRAYHDLFSLVKSVSKRNWARKLPKELPVLVVSGDMDPVGSWGKGPRAVADRLTRAGVPTTLRLYPDMRHEILNEIGREQVWEDMEEWLRKF